MMDSLSKQDNDENSVKEPECLTIDDDCEVVVEEEPKNEIPIEDPLNQHEVSGGLKGLKSILKSNKPLSESCDENKIAKKVKLISNGEVSQGSEEVEKKVAESPTKTKKPEKKRPAKRSIGSSPDASAGDKQRKKKFRSKSPPPYAITQPSDYISDCSSDSIAQMLGVLMARVDCLEQDSSERQLFMDQILRKIPEEGSKEGAVNMTISPQKDRQTKERFLGLNIRTKALMTRVDSLEEDVKNLKSTTEANTTVVNVGINNRINSIESTVQKVKVSVDNMTHEHENIYKILEDLRNKVNNQIIPKTENLETQIQNFLISTDNTNNGVISSENSAKSSMKGRNDSTKKKKDKNRMVNDTMSSNDDETLINPQTISSLLDELDHQETNTGKNNEKSNNKSKTNKEHIQCNAENQAIIQKISKSPNANNKKCDEKDKSVVVAEKNSDEIIDVIDSDDSDASPKKSPKSKETKSDNSAKKKSPKVPLQKDTSEVSTIKLKTKRAHKDSDEETLAIYKKMSMENNEKSIVKDSNENKENEPDKDEQPMKEKFDRTRDAKTDKTKQTVKINLRKSDRSKPKVDIKNHSTDKVNLKHNNNKNTKIFSNRKSRDSNGTEKQKSKSSKTKTTEKEDTESSPEISLRTLRSRGKK